MTSIFDLFKIGIGPSSSHTVGPMRAARAFTQTLDMSQTARIQTELYGSLALTGRGHGTDRAIILGLLGEESDRINPAQIQPLVDGVRQNKLIHGLQFDEARDLLFRGQLTLPGHPNAMRFTAFDADGNVLREAVYYSVGGGFIVREGESNTGSANTPNVPYPFSSAAELLERA
ncbi:MAG: L-serine ammonia-lyase, partial [Acidobacteriota bacterium]|nr:L-serine ammonia-lyase [Acidobacteriota bacterium]